MTFGLAHCFLLSKLARLANSKLYSCVKRAVECTFVTSITAGVVFFRISCALQ